MLDIEDLLGHPVAGVQHLLDHRPDVLGDTCPLEGLVGQRCVVQGHEPGASTDRLVETFEHDLLEADVVVRRPLEHAGEQRRGSLQPRRPDAPLVVRLPLVNRRERLGRERRADAALAVAVSDEGAQEAGQPGQEGRLGHDLAGEPVAQPHLHVHRAPARRIAWPVDGPEPQHAVQQIPVVAIIETVREG